MKRTLFLAFVMVAVLATAASASRAPVEWFYDDFNYADGSSLSNQPNWTGNVPRPVVSGSEAQLDATGAGTYSSNSSPASVGGSSAGVTPQIFHAVVRGEQIDPPGNHAYLYMLDANGEIGRWYGDSRQLTPRYGGTIGPQVSLMDGLQHDLDIIYDPVTGDAKWYGDGLLVWTTNVGAGRNVTHCELQDQPRGQADNVWVDEVSLGTIPEPSSLLALSAFGIGMIGYIKRRRA